MEYQTKKRIPCGKIPLRDPDVFNLNDWESASERARRDDSAARRFHRNR